MAPDYPAGNTCAVSIKYHIIILALMSLTDGIFFFSAVVAKEKCQDEEYAQVCGSNEETYPTLCHLHQAGQKLAYTGPCRPTLCSETVCGSNGVTYPSPCHARAHNVMIDYYGTCFAEK